jgi:hypothetical protein
MKPWIIGCLLLVASFTQAKTRLLVEDPNNVVAGRYSLTSEQETVTELPWVHYYGRFDDYIAIYFGGGGAYSKEGY